MLFIDKFSSNNEKMDETKENEDFHKESSGCKLSIKLKKVFIFARIAAIAALIFWILSGLFKPEVSEVIAGIFVFLLILSAVLGRSIKFYYKHTSRLGFVTEMVFILGVVFSVISMIPGYSYLMVGLPVFSFVIAPGLGIVNRAIKLNRGETKKVYYTIIEMFILGIPVVFAIWILLKMK